MAANQNQPDPPMSQWTLEPLDEPAESAPASQPPPGPAKFHANSRGGDRRSGTDRRQTLRFEADRRSGKDRRPRKGWEPGSNL